MKTAGDRSLYALHQASLPTLASLFGDLRRRKRAKGSDRAALVEAMAEIHHLGCQLYGPNAFAAAVDAEHRRSLMASPREVVDGSAARAAAESLGDWTIAAALLSLFDEQGAERLRAPFIVKELSRRLRAPQRRVKARLADVRPLVADVLYYEFASVGVLRRDKETTLRHYFVVDGAWCAAIRRLPLP